jgi:acetyl-CoA C-acetyltransferase
MAIHCERLGEKYGISREQQDEFAAMSQQRCEAAMAASKFAEEIVPVKVKRGKEEVLFDTDEHPRAGTTVESLAKLRPAFEPTGTITAGNASGVNDGASAVVLASGETVSRLGLTTLGRVLGWAYAATEPSLFGIAPAGAVRKALDRAGVSLSDVDLIEANEAFAVQSLALGRETGWDADRVNVNGGAIALGHPIGASGARIVTTLLHEMRRRGNKTGLATLCCGGGMGIALVVSRE